ncbi:phosphate acetyltransferase [Clavibacter michiganensis subsp. insidiosus]|uniref:Phosphate acetyltransferase n=1 Tax=Clavibacter michiganensis subsp. insidiosus TaxID=33014 RepID=A0A399SPK5_9MICO|nr:phosphate acetyltransferase [Clavibacter michiganensis]AWG00666.1 phosphate acetyltransferase [Clavibacter michiganensis subsp. insidiosus]OQJ60728.1 phosphate acetyltransferase [Clavibacter michiganensis subsp. insidiosus]RII87089.1 phosphate acetyltransferase [Clavibacter michiganensis subsp. insidiosus]RIJ44541.1 phosphate acetyltransferase [Clavibacter michiganensis subsp. insidiosus]RMC81991.1 phosphate acetyltransferase [Clavibacter michiganensis subsp. insidiosus]
MARSIYITSAEGHSGKSTVALGVLDTLTHQIQRVGVFRPIARSIVERDYVLEALLSHDGVDLDYDECVGVTYDDVHADPEAALSRIVERYKAVEAKCDVVVVVGSDYTDVGSPTELSFNARIAANLGAPVLLVLTGRRTDETGGRSPDEMRQIADLAIPELVTAHAGLLGVVVNRADPEQLDAITAAIPAAVPASLQARAPHVPVWAIPEDAFLVAPTVAELLDAVDGTLVKGDAALLSREALGVVVSAMSMENVLARLTEGAIVVIPGDRSEVLLGVLTAHASETFPTVAGIVLNGGFALSPTIERLVSGLDETLPIISTELGTYETAKRITQTRGRLSPESSRKMDTALAAFEQHVDTSRLLELLDVSRSDVVTPLMFEYGLIERARRAGKRIVLPEGTDDRVLRAAGTILRRGIADVTILGEEIEVRSRAIGLGIDIGRATVLSPFDAVLRERFAEEYVRLRAHKGMVLDIARETVTDVSYFGTMMVQLGLADGMVSGAAHTTAHTIRPGFEIIKTTEGVSVVSSVFLMALADRVLVYGDCAVNPDPTADQLADIAISSAETAAQFGIEPRIAMLSYSTGESGAGADVEKVRQATARVRELRPDLAVEGPIQYDAAADAAVAATKMPDSQVAGRATVFIFPDLNTGNNTYKAVQRSAGAVAIGPVLQGLRKPINDLSRGALVQDIVNTVAITAIQAEGIQAG